MCECVLEYAHMSDLFDHTMCECVMEYANMSDLSNKTPVVSVQPQQPQFETHVFDITQTNVFFVCACTSSCIATAKIEYLHI